MNRLGRAVDAGETDFHLVVPDAPADPLETTLIRRGPIALKSSFDPMPYLEHANPIGYTEISESFGEVSLSFKLYRPYTLLRFLATQEGDYDRESLARLFEPTTEAERRNSIYMSIITYENLFQIIEKILKHFRAGERWLGIGDMPEEVLKYMKKPAHRFLWLELSGDLRGQAGGYYRILDVLIKQNIRPEQVDNPIKDALEDCAAAKTRLDQLREVHGEGIYSHPEGVEAKVEACQKVMEVLNAVKEEHEIHRSTRQLTTYLG